MIFKPGIISALILLVVLSLVAVSGVAIVAQQKKFTRQINLAQSRPKAGSASTAGSSGVRGPCYPMGDVDDDGALKANDATAILNYVAGISQRTFIQERGYLNLDAKVDAMDAAVLKQYLAGQIARFPNCPIP